MTAIPDLTHDTVTLISSTSITSTLYCTVGSDVEVLSFQHSQSTHPLPSASQKFHYNLTTIEVAPTVLPPGSDTDRSKTALLSCHKIPCIHLQFTLWQEIVQS